MSRQQEKQIKLAISPEIDNNGEIRLGKLARENLGFTNRDITDLEVWSNPFIDSRLYTTKKAFSKDLKGIPVKDKKTTCFVSKETYNKLIDSCDALTINKQFWISTKKNTCIGSDPEFIIFTDVEQNKIIHASDILSFESPIGSDGILGELRALPGLTSEDHVNNLEVLIKNINNKLDPDVYKCRVLPYASCNNQSAPSYNNTYRVSCGGHIHFGLTKKITDHSYIYDVVVSILDRTLAICMQRLDGDLGYKRRVDLDYGVPGDYRNNESSYRLEYRVLSATWLLYKDLANIVLGISSSLIESITSRIAEFSSTIGSYNLESGETAQKSFITNELFPELSLLIENYSNRDISKLLTGVSVDTSAFRTYVETVLECMSQFTDSEYFEPFTRIVLANTKYYENFDPDFINNWTSNTSVFDHLNTSNLNK
jgi:hypothetical protein